VFLVYGRFKIIVGVASLASEKAANAQDKVPLVTVFVTPDRSPAGLITKFLITMFSVYTLVEGASHILRWEKVHAKLASPLAQTVLATTFGLLFLVVTGAAILDAKKAGRELWSPLLTVCGAPVHQPRFERLGHRAPLHHRLRSPSN